MAQIIYVGGPTVILEILGFRLMTDPTFDPAGSGYPTGESPAYRKLAGPAFADRGPIDLVLLSHDQHSDNLDHAGRDVVRHAAKTLTTKVGAVRLGGNAVGLAPWESIAIPAPNGGQIQITATPARHGPAGSEKLTGEVIGFVVSVSGSEAFEIYLTGDTVFYSGIEEVARRFKPANVFIFAGAAQPRGPFNLTMGANDALDTAAAFPAATITPLHYEGWTHYTEDGDTLKRAFSALDLASRLKLLAPGLPTPLPLV